MATELKKVLVLTAFETEKSRTQKALENFREELHAVVPASSDWDWTFKDVLAPDPFSYRALDREAMRRRRAGEVTEEARSLVAQDLVIFAFPVWNFDLPSPLRTWLDLAIVPGFTFGFGPKGIESKVAHQTWVSVVTSGGPHAEAEAPPFVALQRSAEFLKVNHQVAAFLQVQDFPMPDEKRAAQWTEARSQMRALAQKLKTL